MTTPPETGGFLSGHMRYRKIKDLNEGTFGVVMLAHDTLTNEEVRCCSHTVFV
jgi:hypothetical protein